MGDPKRFKKKYAPSSHPWIMREIEDNRVLRKEYGLKTRKEVLIATSFLKKYKDLAKKLVAKQTVQGDRERQQMMDKLQKLGLVRAGAALDDVLSLQLKDVLERRIQSVLSRKRLARSMGQARQFIAHRHVLANGKEITSPSHLLTMEEEASLGFKTNSTLADDAHPERVLLEIKEIKKEVEEVRNYKGRGRDNRRDNRRENRGAPRGNRPELKRPVSKPESIGAKQ